MAKSKLGQNPFMKKTSEKSSINNNIYTKTSFAAAELIPLSKISTNDGQPRRYFDSEKQELLERSIKEHGILEPPIVRPKENGQYELVTGERRFRAAKTLNLTDIPVVVKHLSDQDAAKIALVENLQREDLNPIEETEGILKLISVELSIEKNEVISLLHSMHNASKGKITQNVLGNSNSKTILTIFDSIGTLKWDSFVVTRLPLLKLPNDTLEAIQKGQIEYTKALVISRIKEETLRVQILQKAIEENLSIKEIKSLMKTSSPRNSQDLSTPQNRIKTLTSKINKSKPWKNDPKKWKRIESLLQKIETIIQIDSE